MSFYWTIAKLILQKFVAPRVPDIVSTIAKLKNTSVQDKGEFATIDHKIAAIEKTLAAQLQVIEQLTAQLQAFQKALTWALGLAVTGLVLSFVAILLCISR